MGAGESASAVADAHRAGLGGYRSGTSPIGLLRNCFDYALADDAKLTGVFTAIRETFRSSGAAELQRLVKEVNIFRNTRIAHQEKPLTETGEAKAALAAWINTALALWKAGKPTAFRQE